MHLLVLAAVAVALAVLLPVVGASGQDPKPSGEAAAFKDAPIDVGSPVKAPADPARKGPEITGLRTKTSRTFAGPGGARVAEMFAVPVNYKDAQGDWKKIDTSLSADGAGAGYAAKSGANEWSVQLPEELGEKPVRIQEGGAWASFKLRGSAGVASVEGNKGTYEDALEGVDAEFSVHPDALKEDLVLASEDAPASYTYDLEASDGLTAKSNAKGGVDFNDAKSQTAFAIAPPVVEDAAGDYGKAVYELERTDTGWALEVRIDRQWLAAQGRKYPVTLDPTFYFSAISVGPERTPQQDCTLDSGSPSTNFCTGWPLYVGRTAAHDHRALLKFDVAGAIPDRQADVLDAQLSLYLEDGTDAVDMDVDLHEATGSWTNAATWAKRDSTNNWTSAGGDFASPRSTYSKNFGQYGDGAFHYFQPNELVQSWVDGSKTNNGMLLKTAETADQMFTISSTDSVDQSKWPSLYVAYEARVGARRQYTFESQTLTDRTSAQVNVASGNLLYNASDINIAGTGMPLGVSRAFNSRSDRFADQGHNWTQNFGSAMGIQRTYSDTRGESAVVYGSSGEPMLFQRDSPGGAFKTPSGVDAVLTEDATTHKFELKFNKSDEIWRFDDHGFITERADRNGNKLSYTIDNDGALTKITDTQGRDVTFTHDTDGHITSATDSTGRTWTYNVSGGQLYGYTDPEGKTTSYAYNSNLDLTDITDPRGNITKIAYDSDSRVTSIKRITSGTSTGPTTSFSYGTLASPCAAPAVAKTVVTDPRGKNTTYCIDKEGRAVKTVDANGHDRTTGFTANSNVNSYSHQGAATALGYDSNDNLESVAQPAGEQSAFEYNDLNPDFKYKPSKSTAPSGASQSYQYDSFGNFGSVRQGNSPTQIQAKLERNGQTEAGVCPDNPSTKPGTVRCAIDGNDKQTQYSYDNQGNLTKITPPVTTGPGTALLGATTITNDSLSRVKTVTDGKSQVKTYSYDKLDRVTKIEYSNGTSIVYSYDANGNQTQRNDSVHGITGYSYDKLNRRTSDTYPSSVTNSYGYDDGGNLTSLTDPGGTVSYTYDDVNNNTSLIEPGSLTTSFGYDARDNRTAKTLPNTVVESTSYDSSNKPTVIEAKKGSTTLSKFTYGYGTSDLRESVTDKDGNKTSYQYYVDFSGAADRNSEWLATAVTTNSAGTTTDSREWDYDNAGNRVEQVVNGTTTSYAYNEANQLCWAYTGSSTAGCASPPTGAVQYRYDANGNETQGTAGRTSVYNIRDQLTSLTVGGVTSNFGYAGPSQAERTSNGGSAQRSNVLGMGGQGTTNWTRDESGGLISQRASSAKHYYLTDGLGSVAALTDSSGNVAQTYKTDPYGVATGGTGTVTNPWQFVGEYKDPAANANLYKIGARNYDPTIGRWTQQDPLDQPDDLQNANKYVYAASDPVNLVDPSGTSLLSDVEKFAKKNARKIAKKAIPGNQLYCFVKRSIKKGDDNTVGDDAKDFVSCINPVADSTEDLIPLLKTRDRD